MTVIPFPRVGRIRPVESKARVSTWLEKHRASLFVLLPLLAVVALFMIINFDGFPGRDNDDEGTYVAQAWAVLYQGKLAHYTYWYDHPPAGWLQIAAYAALTDGYHRAATAVTVGREFMVLAHMASCTLMYILVRRLNFSRAAGVVAVLLFTFSPVALYYHRMVFLDGISVTWVLGALVFAATPRRSLAAALGSAICFAIAVLTKETSLVLLPIIAWTLFRNQPKNGRSWGMAVFGVTFFGIATFYPLYAILKNELLEGPGHVSLVWAIKWQLFERAGTGSILDPSSVSYQTVHWWLQTDPWLLIGGAVMVIPAIFVRQLWPLASGMALLLVMLLRTGYLPQPYVIAMLPFAAILIAGVGDSLFRSRVFEPVKTWPNKFGARTLHLLRWGVARTGIALVLAAAAIFGAYGAPSWVKQDRYSESYNPSEYSRQAVQWVYAHANKSDVIITDDNIWADLVMDGYQKPIWLYKADLDPAVKAKYLKHGWRDIKYLVLPDLSESLLKSLPSVWTAIQHSKVVQVYGEGSSKMIVRVVAREQKE